PLALGGAFGHLDDVELPTQRTERRQHSQPHHRVDAHLPAAAAVILARAADAAKARQVAKRDVAQRDSCDAAKHARQRLRIILASSTKRRVRTTLATGG